MKFIRATLQSSGDSGIPRNMRTTTARERGELESRDFLGEETWIKWKQDYDQMMSFRKSIKGKPSEEQKAILAGNKICLEFYEGVLFHSSSLGEKCVCARCDRKRAKAAKDLAHRQSLWPRICESLTNY